MLVRIVVRSKMLSEHLVLMVRTIVRVFLQKYMDCLGKKCVWMIGGLVICRCCWVFLGCCRWGLMWGMLISNFGKIFRVEFFMMKIYVYYSILIKRNKRMVANANVMTAFLIHLHIVIMSDVKNVRKIMNSRKTSFLLNRFRNI